MIKDTQDPTQILPKLSQITHNCTSLLALTYVEIMNDVNLPQIFCWFQERTLLGAELVMFNPCPGLNFRGCDMVRNLILSSYAYRPLSEQEAIYRRVWLEPFEKVLGERMDEMLDEFLLV
jgi:hypothetical protein